MLDHVILCCSMLCSSMTCYIILPYIILHYVILHYILAQERGRRGPEELHIISVLPYLAEPESPEIPWAKNNSVFKGCLDNLVLENKVSQAGLNLGGSLKVCSFTQNLDIFDAFIGADLNVDPARDRKMAPNQGARPRHSFYWIYDEIYYEFMTKSSEIYYEISESYAIYNEILRLCL